MFRENCLPVKGLFVPVVTRPVQAAQEWDPEAQSMRANGTNP